MSEYAFHSERLGMRPWCADDLEAFHRLFSDDRVIWWRDHERTREESRVSLQRAIDERDQPLRGLGRFAVTTLATGEVVGNVMLRPAGFAEEIEVGYHVMHAHWGCGYATEAARAALAYGFAGLGLERIVAAVAVDNPRSLRVMEKLRMQPDHETVIAGRLHRIFHRTRDSWRLDRDPGAGVGPA